ncbi:DNA-directed RNA polymerase II subunit RPB1-like 16, partial [Homarus americanus]
VRASLTCLTPHLSPASPLHLPHPSHLPHHSPASPLTFPSTTHLPHPSPASPLTCLTPSPASPLTCLHPPPASPPPASSPPASSLTPHLPHPSPAPHPLPASPHSPASPLTCLIPTPPASPLTSLPTPHLPHPSPALPLPASHLLHLGDGLNLTACLITEAVLQVFDHCRGRAAGAVLQVFDHCGAVLQVFDHWAVLQVFDHCGAVLQVFDHCGGRAAGEYGTHIVGGGSRFLQAGSSLSLECVVTHTRGPPTAVLWYHDHHVLDYDSPRGGISLQVEKSGEQTTSRLLLSSVRETDSGNYTCVPVNAPTASVSVHVNNDELRAAVHQGGISLAAHRHPGVGGATLPLLVAVLVVVGGRVTLRIRRSADSHVSPTSSTVTSILQALHSRQSYRPYSHVNSTCPAITSILQVLQSQQQSYRSYNHVLPSQQQSYGSYNHVNPTGPTVTG